MSRTVRHPSAPDIDTRRQKSPRYADTRAAARREAVEIIADSLTTVR